MARVLVDLADPEIADEIRKRFEVLASAAQERLDDKTLDAAELYLDEFELARAIEAYFLVSEADRRDRLRHDNNDPHWTEQAKKAAFTAITLMLFKPLRVISPTAEIHHPLSSVANQVLAVTSSGSLVERDFSQMTWTKQNKALQSPGEHRSRTGRPAENSLPARIHQRSEVWKRPTAIPNRCRSRPPPDRGADYSFRGAFCTLRP